MERTNAKPPFGFRHCIVMENSHYRLVLVGGECCRVVEYDPLDNNAMPTCHWQPMLDTLVYDKLENAWYVE